MLRLLLIGVAVAALALPGTAHAGWRIERSLTIAEHVWKPACDVRVTWGERNPYDPTEVAWARTSDCTVVLRSDFPLGNIPGYDFDGRTDGFSFLCTIVLHEVGHLAGAEHTDHGIMFPLMWRTDPRCADRGRPYLERAGLLPLPARERSGTAG